LGFLSALMTAARAQVAQTNWLTELDLCHLHFEGSREPSAHRSFSGKPPMIGGRAFARGI